MSTITKNGAESNRLTITESTRLAELEPIIERGLTSFVEVGAALLEISDQRLYRGTHSTFAEYVGDKWKMTARRAYQLCDAAEVIKSLPENVNHGSQINERQARELAKVPKEKRAKVIEIAATTGKITAKSIKAAATEPENVPIDMALKDWLPEPGQLVEGFSHGNMGGHYSIFIFPSTTENFFFVNTFYCEGDAAKIGGSLEGSIKATRKDAIEFVVRRAISTARFEDIKWTRYETDTQWKYNKFMFSSYEDYVNRAILGKAA